MQETGNTILYNKIVIGSLLLTFAVYNIVLYKKGAFIKEEVLSAEALSGQQIWQDNNCTACHQFYGLGGFLGCFFRSKQFGNTIFYFFLTRH